MDFVHLLEGKINQIFVICDEEGKIFNLSKPDQVMEHCDSFLAPPIVNLFYLAASPLHTMRRKNSIKNFAN